MTVRITIELERNPSLSYSAGEEVKGVVHIENDHEQTMKGVRIQFSGKAIVNFIHMGHTRYAGKTEYFNVNCYVLGDGTSNLTLPVGARAINFGFRLPRDLPSSFVGEYGRIVYELEAVMDCLSIFENPAKVAVNMRGILDLHEVPGAALPKAMRRSKTVGFFCCGLVGFILRLPKWGYVPGECIKFTMELTNRSRKRVTRTSVKLLQKLGYHVKGKVKWGYRPVCAAEGPAVPTGWPGSYPGTLQIPVAILPTLPVGADVISIEYVIMVVMDVGGLYSPLVGQTSVVIGTIPFTTSTSDGSLDSRVGPMVEQNTFSHERTLLPSSGDPPFDSCPDYWPPPSYDEAVRRGS